MSTPGLVVRLEARVGREEQVRVLLEESLPLAVDEPGTPVWLAARTGPTTFWIVDVHGSEADRQAHLDGSIAQAILDHADEWLAEPPTILPSVVLAVKPAV